MWLSQSRIIVIGKKRTFAPDWVIRGKLAPPFRIGHLHPEIAERLLRVKGTAGFSVLKGLPKERVGLQIEMLAFDRAYFRRGCKQAPLGLGHLAIQPR